MRKVEVFSDYKKWKLLFEEEAKKLKSIFGNEIVDVNHIGSTSVPELKAKPIIDILPVVKDIRIVDDFNDEMKNAGYDPKGENGIPGRRYFQKGGDNRTHHIHIYQLGSHEIERHVAFRDYLRCHPVAKQCYGELKEKLAERYPYDIASYILGKEQLVKTIEAKAMEWYKWDK
ncbi:GrpB family protein [Terribacillus sp. 179-K 1B1 HS]|uniref:GrpB family protein n=1 Tax=Terribacillus sp. 179-K 1B1 HS TaxID=3142388 RepID=UPI0039A142DA